MPTLYLIRGLPGSGKSTLARKLCSERLTFEADQFFTSPDGTYTFDPKLIKDAHASCQARVKEILQDGVFDCAVANTFTQHWELRPYLDMATDLKYTPVIISIETLLFDHELAERNIHGAPVEVIAKMRARWED